ncbi:hypothetical protein [Streptomyces mayteni]
MRTTDPLDFLTTHRDTIFRVLGILAILLVIFLIIRAAAMRLGGWGAAWRRLCREVAVTAHAFAAPARAWLRHRRSLRTLVRALREPATWRDAERALAAAREAAAAGGGRPYAVLVDAESVTVLLAGLDDELPERVPWRVDEDDELDHWSVARAALPPVVPVPDQVPPVLVAVGEVAGRCAFLDLNAGPPMVCVWGDRRSGAALHQAVAAQLTVRLPRGQVVVAEGVHRGFAGPLIRDAHRLAARLPVQAGLPPVLVCAELPDPLPPDLTAPPHELPDLRLLVLGPGRGYVRTLLADRLGQIAVVGSPLVAEGGALGRAIPRVLSAIPPALPPAPPGAGAAPGRDFAELDDEENERAEAEELGLDGGATAILLPRPPVAESEEAEGGDRAGAPHRAGADELDEAGDRAGGGPAVASPGARRGPVRTLHLP